MTKHMHYGLSIHHNYVNYFEKKIKFFDIDENVNNTCLNLELENLYKDWKHVTMVYLTFVERSWEIGIEWVAGKCYFGKGWSEFVIETELDVGDSLLLFKEPLSRYDNINVGIFKGKDKVIDMSQGSKECSASFYKVLSEFSINDSVLVVPKLIKDNYGWKLNDIRKVKVGGESSFVFYNYKRGYFSNLEKFMKYFNLKAGETVIFTMDSSNVLNARIYQVDGKEIDYTDNINGVGWKFLIRASQNAIESGEIEIPRRFVRRFGKGIPGIVSFGLRNGKNFSGQYLHNERKMLELVQIIMYTHLEEELCLFTYCGNGKFEIVVFDISKAKKIFEYTVTEEDDVNNSEEVLLENTAGNEIIDAEMTDESMDSDTEMENVNGETIVQVEMDDPVLTFSAVMTILNIKIVSTCIFSFRCENGEWEVAIVFSNGIPRFSAGWNQFAKYNKLSLNETVEFTMVEEEDGLAFQIGFPGRV
ncbi:hypothetical protein POM88_022020 [Heracleum sosnowskyi]|uniref:TF-B3 domain-containing protein n=1 Tax=Heracleum sosnowskyi TaxID=360622 RepID=A0AAD8MPA8_9APIA|nr:hypothetical protein POM88_022020 [Heracleum sosnowskyi]